MSILVTGADGQLGAEVVRQAEGAAAGVGHAEFDLRKPDAMAAVIEEHRPRVLVNCAAYTQVDRAEEQPHVALAVNATGVGELARLCARHEAALVHVSTDYVFGLDETRSTPYDEDDPPGPVGVYGASKLLGEYAVRAACPRHFVVRTCGLYGHAGKGNFVKTMLRLAGQGGPLRIVDDQVCTPTNVTDLAALLLRLAESAAYGLYHATNAGACSWFEFAREIFRQSGMDVDVEAIPTSEFPRPARRPGYSVMGHRRLQEAGLGPLRAWQEAVAKYVAELAERKK